jgi:hypothetical protein
VNLFLVGGDAGRAADVLESLRAPFLEDGVLTRLPDGACLSHAPSRIGGVEYCITEGGRYALFAGRPIRWDGDEADGRSVLDPALYLDGVPEGMDGRFAVVVDGAVTTDPLGAYPVYRWDGWVSNSPEALRRLSGHAGLDLDALAGVLGGGWSLSGAPVWQGIERVGWPGRSLTAPGAGFSAERSARLLVATVRALADWPGRPNVLLVTGGRDSRLVFAAGLRAGVEMEVRTGGTDDMPDVVIGRQLAAVAGVEHRMLDPHPFGDFLPRWREMAAVLAQTTGGTATLADAAGFPLVDLGGPLPLWHTGQGGEIARGYYGTPDLDGLVRKFLGVRPGRAGVLSVDGEQRVRNSIDEWAASLAAASEDRGDLFYLHQRMARWAAPTHAAVEPVRDSTSALWSARLLPDLLGLPASERARERFHLEVLERLAPELVNLPFEGGRPWPSQQSLLARRTARARTLARKVAAELRRRRPPGLVDVHRLTADERRPPDPFAGALAEIREVVLSAVDHPAWAVLDRARVEALLNTPARALDAMSRAYVLRLATVFAGFPAGRAGPASQ